MGLRGRRTVRQARLLRGDRQVVDTPAGKVEAL